MKLGIIGGTFNPTHKMHLEIAQAAMIQFGLCKVIFITAADPPHKMLSEHINAEDRYRMVELAIDGERGF